ncbi:MAG: hypothetical protein HY067_23190 [Betaproteobacteria bacterium]|nr:hypothetical protein [Betaproteobacteria bacterium]
MKVLKGITALALLTGAAVAFAGGTIDQLQNATQSEFRLLSEDLGAALSYKPLSPAEPLGITGFDIGVSANATSLEHGAVLEKVTSSSAPSTVVVPRIQAIKGLPLNIDIGASYAAVPGSNIKLIGIEAKYAILAGSVATPALAIRGSYTRLSGVDQLDFDTRGIDVSLSKGFTVVTPYVGVGTVWVTSTPKNIPSLTKETFRENKIFGGVNLHFALFNMAFEADKTGDATSYGAKVGLRF